MIPNGLPNDRINANRRLVQNQEFRFCAVSVEIRRKITFSPRFLGFAVEIDQKWPYRVREPQPDSFVAVVHHSRFSQIASHLATATFVSESRFSRPLLRWTCRQSIQSTKESRAMWIHRTMPTPVENQLPKPWQTVQKSHFASEKSPRTIPVAYIRCVVQEHPIRETRAYRPAPIFRPNSSVADRRCTITMSFCRSPMPPTAHIYQITRKQSNVIIVSRIRGSLARPWQFALITARQHSHGSFWHGHVQAVQDDVRVGFGAVALVRATHADGLLSPGGHRRWLWHELLAASGQVHAVRVGRLARGRRRRRRCARLGGVDGHLSLSLAVSVQFDRITGTDPVLCCRFHSLCEWRCGCQYKYK